MNGRIAKMLNKYAGDIAARQGIPLKQAKKKVKKWWNNIPSTHRAEAKQEVEWHLSVNASLKTT